MDLADKLDEGTHPILNAGENFMGTHITANKTLNDLRTVIPNLSSEISYVYSGGVPAEGEVHSREATLNPNMGKDAMVSAARTQLGLLKSKLEAMEDQYQQGIGPMGKGLRFINPDAQQAIAKISAMERQLNGAADAGTSASAPAVGAVEGGYRYKGGDPSQQSSWVKVN